MATALYQALAERCGRPVDWATVVRPDLPRSSSLIAAAGDDGDPDAPGSAVPLYLAISGGAMHLVSIVSTEAPVAWSLPMRQVTRLQVSASDPNLAVIQYEGGDKRPSSLRLVCRQRQALIDAIQVAYTAWTLSQQYTMASLDLQVQAMADLADVLQPETNDRVDLPGTRRFYRAGYWFQAPGNLVDLNDAVKNKPFSTYVFASETGDLGTSSDARLLLRVEPARDYALDGSCSVLSLRLWTETCAHAIAGNESGLEESAPIGKRATQANSAYLVYEAAPLHKDDDASDGTSWQAFQVNVALATRHICLVGLRRHRLPPFADRFQDLLFVYMDERRPKSSPHRLAIDASFNEPVLDIVRSVRSASDESRLPSAVLPVYDEIVVRARSNALADDAARAIWVKDHLQIRPDRTIVGVKWKHLQFAFCGALVRLMPADAEQGPPSAQRQENWTRIRNLSFVEDPLAIVAACEKELNVGGPGDTSKVQATVKARIAQQFLAAVDGGERNRMPIPLSVVALARAAQTLPDRTAAAIIDRVLDYLVHIRAPGTCFAQTDSILDKFNDPALMGDFVCNEGALVDLLSTQHHRYLADLIERAPNGASPTMQPDVYRRLLSKNYNLDLTKVVCAGIAGAAPIRESDAHAWEVTIPALTRLLQSGNLYVKRWAADALGALCQCPPLASIVLAQDTVPGLAIDYLQSSQDPHLMQASARLVAVLLPPGPRFRQLCTSLAAPLVQLLVPVVRGQRRNQDVCKEVASVIGRFCTLAGDDGAHARREFLSNDAVAVLMPFMVHHDMYIGIVETMGAAMSALYFDCDPVNKRRSVTHVEDLRSLLMAMTSRRQRCLVLQILQNCSYRCYPVIKALRRVGFDKLLQAFIDAASAPAPQETQEGRALRQRELDMLQVLYDRVGKHPVVQICFLIETGSSMGPYVRHVPSMCTDAVSTAMLGVNGLDCQIEVQTAYVAYRLAPGKSHGHTFEAPATTVVRLESLETGGSGKGTSDLLGAMLYALEEMDWTGDLRFFVVLAMNPCYGKRFHDADVSKTRRGVRYGSAKLKAQDVLDDVKSANIEVIVEPLSDTLTMMIGEMKKVLNVSVFPDLGFDDAEDRLRHLSQLLGQKIARTFLAEFAC
ncbi:unnamed protein product (mitochondrion) [Plasmodiophora brassicae]|uniref:Uncharacterized protein n=1 Tax=Plasmodiophora brassicae TaxID=37360 RepID=A0A3P3Y6J0_PLABS|nr:unnamed protein product [Plasmodiophora brassicae]